MGFQVTACSGSFSAQRGGEACFASRWCWAAPTLGRSPEVHPRLRQLHFHRLNQPGNTGVCVHPLQPWVPQGESRFQLGAEGT